MNISILQCIYVCVCIYMYYLCYSAIKRNEVLMHPTTWINLKNIICEINQTQIIAYCMIPLCKISQIGRSTEAGSRLVVLMDGGKRKGGVTAMGVEFSLG